MKITILFLIFQILFCNKEEEQFNFIEKITVNSRTEKCLNSNSCFCFSADSALNFLIIAFSKQECKEGKMILTDSVEFTPYFSHIYIYKLQNSQEFSLIWITEYEHYNNVLLYHIKNSDVNFVGSLNEVAAYCSNCESLKFPVNALKIVKTKQEAIEFSFTDDIFIITGDNTNKFESGKIKYIYHSTMKNLKL